ncbi:magnesium transporter MgtE N-terminal domain-containing protein [Spelaeicoccus albus]|uniref:Flagellar motility protein MotE (MotC chaperone) n=1 Tax=Spelaeicoccus albus TaxID=1280376 RepID=A0A7Z0II29_9MICO|nr:CBS domain-containing protein [Spelaeicoccus albus]NYI68089.1 flagellar motility protein MotE (MotC chaperone) [Spelaeicoccus albus]
MSGASDRVFVARLAQTAVFDPLGDQVGRVRDVVVVFRATVRQPPRVVGLVVEVPGRRRVFVPMTRVMSIDSGQVITTGLVNMRRFEQRNAETLILAEMLDRRVTLSEDEAAATIEDVAIAQARNKDWEISKLFVRRRVSDGTSRLGRLRRRGETLQVDWRDVVHDEPSEHDQGAAQLIAAYQDNKAADLADAVHAMPSKRRLEVADELDDERLADVIEELPQDDQIEILSALGIDRAADVLEEMQPDDAADLLGYLPDAQAEHLLSFMEPEDAKDVRTLLAYDDDTAGGLMTTEPVILPPEATIAEALAHVRRSELAPALAAAVYVCRPPLEPPTGTFLGLVHIQEMLRHPPHEAVGALIDSEVEPLSAEAHISEVTRLLAAYDLVSVPVTDEHDRLVGVVTVDDVLDQMLPDDWRTSNDDHDYGGDRG